MVFDTMVFVYALLGVPPFREDALAALDQAREILVPDSFRAEFTNVLWQWVRNRNVPLDRAAELLRVPDRLITDVVPTSLLDGEALRLAVSSDVAVYDTLFVSLAFRRRTKLITCDRELLRKFSDVAISPSDYIGSELTSG